MQSQSIAFLVADAIGPDISYIRYTELTDRRYFTGIELGFLVGSGALFAFLMAFLKGFGEAFGRRVGEESVSALIRFMESLAKRVKGVDRSDPTKCLEQTRSMHDELNSEVLDKLHPVLAEMREAHVDQKVLQQEVYPAVFEYYSSWGFPDSQASRLARSTMDIVLSEFNLPLE